jgi:hypothetical protein
MKPPSRAILVFGALVAVYLVFAVSYETGFRSGRVKGRTDACLAVDWHGSHAQTQDAIRRWLAKGGPREMTGRYSCVTVFPDRNCVQLKLEPGWVGGVPTYCYRANSQQLIEEHSDVE